MKNYKHRVSEQDTVQKVKNLLKAQYELMECVSDLEDSVYYVDEQDHGAGIVSKVNCTILEAEIILDALEGLGVISESDVNDINAKRMLDKLIEASEDEEYFIQRKMFC